MIRVHVLTEERSQSSVAFNFPLRLHQRLLREMGIEIRLCDGEAGGSDYECDTLFLNSNIFGSLWPGLNESVGRGLELARARADRVVWFDTSASSGTTQFEVLPYVDVYCKAQVLRDRQRYLREHHGDRVFTDYYHRKDGVEDEDDGLVKKVLPSREDLDRIRVSWSTALGDFGLRARRYRRFGRYLPALRRYSARFTPPGRPRSISVSGRLGLNHTRATILHHRRQIQRILEHELGIDTRPLPREEYMLELRNAKIGVSPFGYGEVCFRDFEVILAGAALVKPDMSHLETWPPLYSTSTYSPHNWDASDLEPLLRELLDSDRWRGVAESAQSLYRRYLLEREGHVEFAARIAGIVRACRDLPSPSLRGIQGAWPARGG